jgi:3-isopropylmalate/(R)-2-methylmalate dehydratase small subunit
MEAFVVHRGRVAPLLRRDIDTDQIIPKQFLKVVDRSGFAEGLFFDWRRRPDGTQDAEFVLNNPHYRGASILLAGANFGCGSSREHAAWALYDAGFRAVIAPSFADIFRANAVTNGLLPVVLPEEIVLEIARRCESVAGYSITIDLQRSRATDDAGVDVAFDIDPAARKRLLAGLDDVGIILQYEPDIATYETRTQQLSRLPS